MMNNNFLTVLKKNLINLVLFFDIEIWTILICSICFPKYVAITLSLLCFDITIDLLIILMLISSSLPIIFYVSWLWLNETNSKLAKFVLFAILFDLDIFILISFFCFLSLFMGTFYNLNLTNLVTDLKYIIESAPASLLIFILTLLPILISVAFFILAERKVMASVQRRKGPNVVGLYGLLQPLIDAVKLLTKEAIIPSKANKLLFILGPVLTLTIALIGWTFLPFSDTNYYLDLEYGLLFFLGFSSVSVYGLLISGWASNSKYALMGALRTVSQFISYEISFGILLLPVVLLSQSLNFIDIVLWQIKTIWFIIPLWPVALLFFVAILAETNRTPFDLPEAEAELVAGYNTEYASVFFIMFMFAEYSNVLLMSALFTLLFLGGWSLFFVDLFFFPEIIFSFKLTCVAFLFILIRASYPRLRFDQLMNFGWQRVLPLSLSLIFLVTGLICFVTNFTI